MTLPRFYSQANTEPGALNEATVLSSLFGQATVRVLCIHFTAFLHRVILSISPVNYNIRDGREDILQSSQ